MFWLLVEKVKNNVPKYFGYCIMLIIIGIILIATDFISALGWILVILFIIPAGMLGYIWFNLHKVESAINLAQQNALASINQI